jgi:tyrosyl-tRNA synthetase
MYRYYELLTQDDLIAVKALHPKQAKLELSQKITCKYWGEQKSQNAKEEFERIFAKKDLPDILEEFKAQKGSKISDILFNSALVLSKNEAKRLIEQGGVKINGEKLSADKEIKENEDFVLQAGKRKFKKIVF